MPASLKRKHRPTSTGSLPDSGKSRNALDEWKIRRVRQLLQIAKIVLKQILLEEACFARTDHEILQLRSDVYQQIVNVLIPPD